MAPRRLIRTSWLAVALLSACGGSAGGEADTEASSSSSDATSSSPESSSTTGPSDCVAGQETCPCLDGGCVGSLHCIDQTCVPGPEIDVDDDAIEVLAGLRVPLEVELIADEFAWSQVGGPSVEIVGADTLSPRIDVPATAQPGDVVILRLTAVRNSVEDSIDLQVAVIEAVFESAFADVLGEGAFGSATALDFGQSQMWVVAAEGFVTRIDSRGATTTADLVGVPHGARLGRIPSGGDSIDALYYADTLGAVRTLTVNGNNAAVVTDAAEGGLALGTVVSVAPTNQGDVYFGNREGQVFFYGRDDGVTRLFIEGVGVASAIALGPEGGVLYLGTAGKVLRVPVLADNTAGDPDVYLDVGEVDSAPEVSGIAFDEAYNVWVSTAETSTLRVARYSASTAVETARTFSNVDASVSEFGDLRFGRSGFDDRTLHWSNFGVGMAGRLRVGLRGG